MATQGAPVYGPWLAVDEPEEEGDQGGQREEGIHPPGRTIRVGGQATHTKAAVHKGADVYTMGEEDRIRTRMSTCQMV